MNQIRPVSNSISAQELRQKASAHLEHHRSALVSERKEEDFVKLESELKTAQTNNRVLLEQNEVLKKDFSASTKQIEELKSVNVELQARIKELEPKAKDGEAYREDLINEALELGVKLQGNSFDRATYEKMLHEPQRSIDEIKNIRDQFLNTLMEKFPIGKQTKEHETNLPDSSRQSIVPDEAFKV
jgi:chromosome segregation ATPase